VIIFLKSLLVSILLLYCTQYTASSVVSPDGFIGVDKEWPRPMKIYFSNVGEAFLENSCSGTLIEKDVILTAAHCLPDIGERLDGRVNVLYTKKLGMSLGPHVKSFIKHHRYNYKTGVNDIGLIFLTEPIKDVPLSKISTMNYKFTKSDPLIIMGWGYDQNGEIPQKYAYYAFLEDYSYKALNYYDNFNKETMIVAGKYRPEEDLFTGGCQGDSGGPLLYYSDNSFYIVGITSHSSAEDCNEKIPTAFTKVSFYIEWICSYIITNSNYFNNTDCKNVSKPSTTVIEKESSNKEIISNSNYIEESVEIVENDVSAPYFERIKQWVLDRFQWVYDRFPFIVFLLVIGLFNLFTSLNKERASKKRRDSVTVVNKKELEWNIYDEENDDTSNFIKYSVLRGDGQEFAKSYSNNNPYGLNLRFYNFSEDYAIHCSLNVDKNLLDAGFLPIFVSNENDLIKLPYLKEVEENGMIIKISMLYIPKLEMNKDVYITLWFVNNKNDLLIINNNKSIKKKTHNINNRQTIDHNLVNNINTLPNKSKQNSNFYGLNRRFYNFREAGAIYCCLDVDKSKYSSQVIPIFETDDSAVLELPEEYNNEDNITIMVNNIFLHKIGKSYDIYITLYFT